MRLDWRRLALIAAIAFLAAIAGLFAGRAYFGATPRHENALHNVLHNELALGDTQKAQIAALEGQFAARRKTLEQQLRADNALLADAIEAEHSNGLQVRAAVDRIHRTMGELQKETLAHIFAIRRILTPDQAAKFDRTVVRALTAEQR